MKIKYFERVTKEAYLADIMELLSLCDQEFIPPLSARSSTIQSNLGPQGGKREGPVAYFENIQHQPAFLAVDDGRVVGFMSLKKNYVCEEIPPSHSPNVYVTTVIVHPHYRRHGITNGFYHHLFKKFGSGNVFTRTWSTNLSHIRILSSLKFYEHCRLEDDRGPGIDTIYYYHGPVAKKSRQVMKQYRLTGNFLFLLLLVVLTAAFVTAWSLTDGGVLHELSIAFATSLIALALCLLSDTLLKYKESQNDEYINNLKSFGIENLRFHKDELLELLIPKCRNEIWITGYRLIMTGKKSFRRALCQACAETKGLRVRVLAVPPWSRTYQLVYGTEDVSDNYIKIFSDLCSCAENYGTNLEIRFTEKPIFNDTYKIDDRFITGPYLHCLDKNNGRITAKDFFSLDINDPQKELYGLIYKDYMTVWEESRARLNNARFLSRVQARGTSDLTAEEKCELLIRCCETIGGKEKQPERDASLAAAD